jgi:hypothetical protein
MDEVEVDDVSESERAGDGAQWTVFLFLAAGVAAIPSSLTLSQSQPTASPHHVVASYHTQ